MIGISGFCMDGTTLTGTAFEWVQILQQWTTLMMYAKGLAGTTQRRYSTDAVHVLTKLIILSSN